MSLEGHYQPTQSTSRKWMGGDERGSVDPRQAIERKPPPPTMWEKLTGRGEWMSRYKADKRVATQQMRSRRYQIYKQQKQKEVEHVKEREKFVKDLRHKWHVDSYLEAAERYPTQPSWQTRSQQAQAYYDKQLKRYDEDYEKMLKREKFDTQQLLREEHQQAIHAMVEKLNTGRDDEEKRHMPPSAIQRGV